MVFVLSRWQEGYAAAIPLYPRFSATIIYLICSGQNFTFMTNLCISDTIALQRHEDSTSFPLDLSRWDIGQHTSDHDCTDRWRHQHNMAALVWGVLRHWEEVETFHHYLSKSKDTTRNCSSTHTIQNLLCGGNKIRPKPAPQEHGQACCSDSLPQKVVKSSKTLDTGSTRPSKLRNPTRFLQRTLTEVKWSCVELLLMLRSVRH